ncbi:MAG: cell filamentation protein Fic [Oscillospiraceae bacterium]
MQSKYQMTREQNIFVAKRNIVDYIWKSAKLEGINVTFPETNAIFEGMGVESVKVEDIVKINNMKRAWSFLLDTLDRFTDFDYLCRVNMIIGGDGSIFGAGKIRAYDVKISGTKWQPQIPFEYDVRNEMMDILSIKSPTERAITLMLWCMRRQIFIDGNKRTAMMIANKEMIVNGCGIISISVDKIRPFGELLIAFYETNNMTEIKQFVYDNCIDGIDFESKITQQPENDDDLEL